MNLIEGYKRKIFSSLVVLMAMTVIPVHAATYAYIYTNDGRFAKIDLIKNQVLTTGTLGYNSVFQVIQDPQHRRIFILASKPAGKGMLDEESKKEELLVLDDQGKLQKSISDPIRPGDHVEVRLTPNGEKIILGLSSAEKKRYIVMVLDGKTYKEVRRTEGFRLFKDSTISEDGQNLYTADANNSILSIDIKDMRISKSSYEHIGSKDYFSKSIVASIGSLALILENIKNPHKNPDDDWRPQIFLYDIKHEKVLSTFHIKGYGKFHILPNRKLVLMDEEKWTLAGLPPEQQSGVRPRRLGKLHVYNAHTGERMMIIDLPARGKFVNVSPDEKTAYYFSPKLITLVDLEKFKVLKRIEVPFVDGMVAIVNAEERQAAKPAPPAKKK